MSEPSRRRPLPALICLIALTLLTALVWWRVLNRSDHTSKAHDASCTPARQTTLPNPSTLSITVLNGTNRGGLAKTTASQLAAVGFKIASYANDTGPIAGVAQIRYSADEKPAAQLLGYYFPTATQVPIPDQTGKLVVSLGAKYTALPAAASVQAAMKADGVTVAPRNATPAPAPTSTC
jgi:hypothetical protein